MWLVGFDGAAVGVDDELFAVVVAGEAVLFALVEGLEFLFEVAGDAFRRLPVDGAGETFLDERPR